MTITTYFQAKKRPRPSSIYTDRRSLNRAKPPPIYLQREEEVTPGIWPKERKPVKPRKIIPTPPTSASGTATKPLASYIGGDADKSKPADGADRVAPLRSIRNSNHGSSRFQLERRVVSEDVDRATAASKSIRNPLQNRLQSSLRRRSEQVATTGVMRTTKFNSGGGAGGGGGGGSSVMKVESERVVTGVGTLRLSKPLTQYQGGRNTAVNPRDLASSGYAQLRNRERAISQDDANSAAAAAAAQTGAASSAGGGGAASVSKPSAGVLGSARKKNSIGGGYLGGGGGTVPQEASVSSFRLPIISPAKAAASTPIVGGGGAAASITEKQKILVKA